MRRFSDRLMVWMSTPIGLAVLFGTGFAIRLVLARSGGHSYDLAAFHNWADRLAASGPNHFYPGPGDNFYVDYPPGYLYVLWAVGKIAHTFGDGQLGTLGLKLAPCLADLALAAVIVVLADRLTPPDTFRPSVTGLAAAAVLLNPAVFFVSAVWGQADVFGGLLVAAGLLAMGTGPPTYRREALGMVLIAAAVATKPQAALVLPVVIVVLAYRHVRSRPFVGVARLASLGAIGALAGLALLAPFRLGPVSGFEFYKRAADTYKLNSLFAFNLWGVFGFWRPDTGQDALRIFGVSAVRVGLTLFIAAGVLVAWRTISALRSGVHEGRVLVFGCVAITLAGYVFLTRIHERYLFIPVALFAALVGLRALRAPFVGVSAVYLINLVLPYLDHYRSAGRPQPGIADLVYVFYGSETGGIRQRVLSGVTAAFCLFVAWFGWRALDGVRRTS